MTDPIPPTDDAGSGGSAPPTPRWVKAFGLLALALVLLFVIEHLFGGGFRSHMGH